MDALRQARSIRDGLGRGLDPEMVRPIAALIYLGIQTTQSCAGHPDHGTSFPWIDIEASRKEREMLSRELPSFHPVKRGSQSFPDNYRIQPREIATINSPDPGESWAGELQELQEFSERVLPHSRNDWPIRQSPFTSWAKRGQVGFPDSDLAHKNLAHKTSCRAGLSLDFSHAGHPSAPAFTPGKHT